MAFYFHFCLYFVFVDNLPVSTKEALKHFLAGNFGEVLEGELGKKLFASTSEGDRLDTVIHSNVKQIFHIADSQADSLQW